MNKPLKRYAKRRDRVRAKLRKVSNGVPRLSVFRSANNIYAQLIDDSKGHTIASASTKDKDLSKKIKKAGNVEAAAIVGAELAKRSLKVLKDPNICFDRGGYLFHGRVKALAEAARENGLKF